MWKCEKTSHPGCSLTVAAQYFLGNVLNAAHKMELTPSRGPQDQPSGAAELVHSGHFSRSVTSAALFRHGYIHCLNLLMLSLLGEQNKLHVWAFHFVSSESHSGDPFFPLNFILKFLEGVLFSFSNFGAPREIPSVFVRTWWPWNVEGITSCVQTWDYSQGRASRHWLWGTADVKAFMSLIITLLQ